MRLLYFFMLCSIAATAQINFENGYYINNSGRKVPGLIRNVGWNNNPTSIDFKSDENAPATSVRISEMTEFAVGEGYLYRKFNIQYDTSAIETGALSQTRNPIWESETAMLKVLSEGKLILYGYEDHNLTRFFIADSPSKTPEQLIYKEYNATGIKIGQNNQFRQQLFVAMGGGKGLKEPDFERLSYSKKDMLKIFAKFNGEKQTEYAKKQNKGDFNLRVIAGASLAKMEFSQITLDINGEFGQQTVPTFGLEAEYVLPLNQNKWSILLGANYQSYKGDTYREGFYTFNVDYQSIEVPLALRHYFFLNDRLAVFANVGYNLSVNLDSHIEVMRTNFDNPSEIDISRSSNFMAGVGAKYERFAVEFRYHANRDILSLAYWNAQYQSMGLLVSYQLL